MPPGLPTPVEVRLPSDVLFKFGSATMSLADRQTQRRHEVCAALETGDRQTIGNTSSYYSPIKFDMLPGGAAVTFSAL